MYSKTAIECNGFNLDVGLHCDPVLHLVFESADVLQEGQPETGAC